MFTVKATYRSETRRFTFPESVLFPTYNELHNQLYRVFPIGRDYYLSRLIFSPDASKPGRILVGKEVHSAEDYDSHTAPLRRLWPNPLLRFIIFDETSPQKEPSVSERLSLYNASNVPLPDVTFKSRSPFKANHNHVSPLNSPSFVLPSPPLQPSIPTSCARHSPSKISPLPPPPMTFSPASERLGTLHNCGTGVAVPCCPMAKGKADIQILLSSFKEDLDGILARTFGTGCVEQQTTSPVKGPTCIISGAEDVSPQTETSFSAGVNTSRWCFVCRTSFAGVWYGCIKCPWHAVCPGCFFKSHSAHTLSFGPSHVVERRSTDRSAQVPAHVAGETGVLGTSQPPRFAFSSPAGRPAGSVHRGVTCDECNKTIVGIRHKCLDCPDYDLCTACMDSGAAERHNPFDEFVDIETPGRAYVHTVLGRDRDRSLGSYQQVSNSDHVQVRQGPATTPADPPVRHSATCNLCDSAIVGERYKCVTCPDFDTCSSCFRITTEQHPSHGFVKVSKPEDLTMRDSIPLRQVSHLAVCDSCHHTIRGTRYKCMHRGCPDFDLCADCEALPIPVHPLNHPMLKLKTSDAIIPTVYRIEQSRTVEEPSDQKPVSVCSESHTPSSRSPLATPMESSELITVGQTANLAVEDETSFAENFLSPLGSPVVDVPGEVPASISPSHLVDVAESPESPRSIHLPSEIYHQLSSRVIQEMMHLNANAVQALQAEGPIVIPIEYAVTESAAREPLVVESPLLATPTASPTSNPVSPVSGTKSIVDDYRTPPPTSSDAHELHHIIQELVAGDQGEMIAEDAPRQSYLDSTLVSDTNVPDGQIFPPGAEFVKGWHMINNGGQPWPSTTEVQFVAGEKFAPGSSAALRAKVGVVRPGQDLDVWTGDLKAPDVPGRYVGYWRLNGGQGNFFGNSVWIDLTVADHYSDQASEHSLAASSMVMPSAHPTNSVNGSDELQDVLPQPSLPSTETAMDEVEDPESDISSVSLVSVPTSDEDAEWQDSRTHSEPLEYVVLYDSNSEE